MSTIFLFVIVLETALLAYLVLGIAIGMVLSMLTNKENA